LGGKGGAINYQKKRIKIVRISPIDRYPDIVASNENNPRLIKPEIGFLYSPENSLRCVSQTNSSLPSIVIS